MRTTISKEQVTAIVEEYLEHRGVRLNYLQYESDEYGAFYGVVIDHDSAIALPDLSELER